MSTHISRCLLSLMVMISASADAAEWIVVRIPGVQAEHAFDLSTTFLFADEVTFWRRIRPVAPAAGQRLLRERIQCTQHTLATLTELDYDQDGKLLKVVTSSARDPVLIERAEERELALAICRLIGRKGGEAVAASRAARGEMQ